MKLLQQCVPKGFVELQDLFMGQRMANSDSLKESAHILTWSELK